MSERFTVELCRANVGYVWEVYDSEDPRPFGKNRQLGHGPREHIAAFVYREYAEWFARIANATLPGEKQP